MLFKEIFFLNLIESAVTLITNAPYCLLGSVDRFTNGKHVYIIDLIPIFY